MVEEFVRTYAELIVDHPDHLQIERHSIDENFDEIVIYAHTDDAGKLIGREGRMINALRIFIGGCKAKDGMSYRFNVRGRES